VQGERRGGHGRGKVPGGGRGATAPRAEAAALALPVPCSRTAAASTSAQHNRFAESRLESRLEPSESEWGESKRSGRADRGEPCRSDRRVEREAHGWSRRSSRRRLQYGRAAPRRAANAVWSSRDRRPALPGPRRSEPRRVAEPRVIDRPAQSVHVPPGTIAGFNETQCV